MCLHMVYGKFLVLLSLCLYGIGNVWYSILILYEFWVFFSKIIVSILLLILIRGGVPRFRYDHLSRLGWLNFIFDIFGLIIITLIFIILF